MNRVVPFLALLLVVGCASNPTFTQAERISFALTPANVSRVQFWTVNTFQLRGATSLITQGETAISAGVQYQEVITVKAGTPAVISEMPDDRTVVADVGLVLDVANPNFGRTLLLTFSADEDGLYTLREVAGQSVAGPIKIGNQEYAYYTCRGDRRSNPNCSHTLPLGADADPTVTLRFKAAVIERKSGVSGQYVVP